MATVGYGDFAPKTVTGRVVAVALMVIGIGFFALLTGAIAQRFLAEEVSELAASEARFEQDEKAAREQVLSEIRSIAKRLRELEEEVARLL